MTRHLWILLWAVGAGLVVVAYVRLRARLEERIRPKRLDDDDVRTILETGELVTDEDEPLDLDEIEEEERRFWRDERWDEAEEW